METNKFQELTIEELVSIDGGGIGDYLLGKLIDAVADAIERALKDLAGPNV